MMPRIKYLRNMEGAIKMNEAGYCWADCVLWSLGDIESVRRGMEKHPGHHAKNFVTTMEDVRLPKKCGYCGNCMTDEEIEAYHTSSLKETE